MWIVAILVPIGYGKNNSLIGDLYVVDSWDAGGIADQHKWLGYQFDKDGNLAFDAKTSLWIVKRESKRKFDKLGKMRKAFQDSNGGLSSSEELYLDAANAKLVVGRQRRLFELQSNGFIQLLRKGIREAKAEWQGALRDARDFSTQLTLNEMENALAAGGASQKYIQDDPIQRWQGSITNIQSLGDGLDDLLDKTDKAIDTIVNADSQLAGQLEKLGGDI